MKKFTKLTAALLLLASASPALKAQEMVEISPYTEGFETSVSSSNSTATAAKYSGWGAITDSWNGYSFNYNTTSTSCHGGVYALYTSSDRNRTNWQTSETHEFQDYLVTPLVKGTVSFYARRYSKSSTPSVKLYSCTSTDNGFEVRDLIVDFSDTLQTLSDTSTYLELSTEIGDEYQYVALWLEKVAIDDFSATSAKMAVKRSLSIGAWKFPSGYSATVTQNADGTVPITGYVELTNEGNVTLSPDDANGYLMLVRSNDQTCVFDEHIALPKAVAPGDTIHCNYSGNITLPAELTESLNSSFQYRVGLMWKEMYGETTGGIKWFDINPNVPIMTVKYGSSNYTSTTVIDYGIGSGSAKADFDIYNRGGSDLVINGVTCPDGVSVTLPDGVSYPMTVAPGETVKVWVNMASEKTGVIGGDVVFDVADGAIIVDSSNRPTNVIKVNGSIVSPEDYYENFELGAIPAGWYNMPGSNWKIDQRPVSSSSKEGYALSNGSQMNDGVGTSIVTPKLHFEEGEAINFYAGKQYSSSADGIGINVYYSADRAEWTSLGHVVSTTAMQEAYPDAQMLPENQYVYYGYKMDMPEGDYYIRFEAGYVYIDDIFGGKLVEVDYDLVPGEITVGKNPTLNNALSLSTSVTNLIDKAVAEDSYTVTFYENGKQVGAVPASPEIGNGTTTYSTVYYPHTAGEVTVKAVLAANDGTLRLTSAEATFTVAAETASNDYEIGDLSTSNQAYAPFALNWNNSRSEMIYTAEELGLTPGSAITKIAFPYYCEDTKDYNTHVRVWMENTDATEPTMYFSNTDSLTNVYDNESFAALPAAGSKTSLDGLASFTLNGDGFVYTGGNLRIVCESRATNYKQVYFAYDTSKTKKILAVRYDPESTYLSYIDPEKQQSSYQTYFPVMYISTAKAVTPNKGVVKDSEGNLIEGAAVKAEYPVDDVNSIYYEATTNADGEFEFTIYRTDVEGDYNLAVNAAGYEPANTTVAPTDQETVVVLNKAASLYPETLYLYGTYYVNGEVRQWDMNNAIALIKDEENEGLFSVSGINFDTTEEEEVEVDSDEEGDGNTTIGGVTPTVKYAYFAFCENASATAPGRTYGATEPRLELTESGEYTLEAGTNLFRISPATCDLTVDLAAGTLTIKIYSATDGLNTISTDLTAGPVDVYNLQGVLLRRGVDRAAATTGLPRGIYIVGGRKALVK